VVEVIGALAVVRLAVEDERAEHDRAALADLEAADHVIGRPAEA